MMVVVMQIMVSFSLSQAFVFQLLVIDFSYVDLL